LNLASVVIPTFRDGARARDAAIAMLEQALPPGWQIEIVVVDDGSGDDTGVVVSALARAEIRLLSLVDNRGRSAARNAGAHLASGSVLIFMDCDCLPHDAHFVAGHIDALQSGAVAAVGHVSGPDNTFWSRYQAVASRRRERQHRSGHPYSGSSQNLAVRREAFEHVGGFDVGYRHYGFEDRDLLIRLSRLGRISWTAGPGVLHRDRLCMRQVARKMFEAGRYTSTRFAQSHPEPYVALGYAALDLRQHRGLAWVARLASPMQDVLARAVDVALALPLPFFAKALLVKATTGLAYLIGTASTDQASAAEHDA
jgi:glycosyltransferase involved in cell wall biosynthesis